MKIKLLLILMLIMPVTAKAENFKGQKRLAVDTVGVVNPWLPVKVDKRLTREAVGIIRASGLRYAIGKYRQVSDPFETFDGGRLYGEQFGSLTNDAFKAEFYYWQHKLWRKVGRISLVSSPPWFFGGTGVWKDGAVPYFGGRAEVGMGLYGCLAYASAAQYGNGGVPRYRHSLVIRIHELLHCGNAEHIDGQVNIMHPAAAHFVSGNPNIPILPLTVEQVGDYLGGR